MLNQECLDLDAIEVVGYDLDNTLYIVSDEANRVIQGYIYQLCAEALDISVEEAQCQFDELYEGGKWLSGGTVIKKMGVVTDRDFVQEALEHADVASTLHPDPEVVELVDQQGTAYRSVDLITGSDKNQTDRKLAAIGLSPAAFGIIIVSEDYSKSNGDAYRHWMSLYPELQPEQFLYVGDRKKVDSDVPSELGIQTALVNVRELDTELLVPQFTDITKFGNFVLAKAA